MSEAYHVLIVDDDTAQAEMVKEFLNISGFPHVDWAKNIHEFWLKLKTETYDIVLLDYMLPDGTGLDVLDKMAAEDYKIPVVMVTGQGDERVAVRAIQRGAADYLLKSGSYLITLPSLINKTIRAHKLHLSVQRSLEKIRYQAMLLNNVRDAIVVWDLQERITYWNPAASTLFGHSREQRLGKQVEEVYLAAFSPPVKIPSQIEANQEHILRQYRHPNGKRIWVSSSVTALRDTEAGDRLLGYMDICHDISARVEAEEALKKSEERYRAIVEDYQTELICRFLPDGSFTFVNEVFCDFFGKSRAEMLRMNILDVIPQEDHRYFAHHLTLFGPDVSVRTVEHRVVVPGDASDGDRSDAPGVKLRWLQHTDRAIYSSQKTILEFQSVGRDISKRKKMESEIRAAQTHLVQAARLATIGEMASGVAHQIYNPLTTIIADAQILLRQMDKHQPGRDSAEAIEQAGWRMQEVVHRLMEFSRPASAATKALSINQTIRNALTLVGAQIEAAGYKLKVNLSDGLPAVRGDGRQLEDLWVNLLLLARDASRDGRGDSIRVVTSVTGRNVVIVEVRDNGRPIPPDELETIFEPNFVGPTSGRGTGLELSICREIVRQHGGDISAESALGHDTIFRVMLPGLAPLHKLKTDS